MSCDRVQVIFLFVHVSVTCVYFFLSNEAISMAVRDFLIFFFNFKMKVSVKKYHSLNYLLVVSSDNFGHIPPHHF